jgi:regulator of protease activity HflC (stomatin/prohibitin superfamily)
MGWVLAVAAAIAALGLLRGLKRSAVQPGEVGLIYRDGVFVRELGPGAHRWFDLLGRTRLHRVALLPQALAPVALDVISKDQFAFRVVVTPLVTITDARAFHEGTRPAPAVPANLAAYVTQLHASYDRLHATLAAAALHVVSQLTLEEFLARQATSLAPAHAAVAEVLPGTRLDALLVTSVTLPPEVRKMFTEVERARREGLAQLERARGEQAALRALANAARNLADNPHLAQLRMLQTMENAKGAKTFILGRPGEGPASEGPA